MQEFDKRVGNEIGLEATCVLLRFVVAMDPGSFRAQSNLTWIMNCYRAGFGKFTCLNWMLFTNPDVWNLHGKS
jgi:hypothetical protein